MTAVKVAPGNEEVLAHFTEQKYHIKDAWC